MSCLFRFLILSCFVFSTLQGGCPPNLSSQDFESLQPYMLPDNHPAKKTLDQLFSSPQVLQNDQTLKKAKFKKIGTGYSKIKVLQHKKLKKYFIKAYTDDQVGISEWEVFMRRVQGAILTRQVIENHQVSDLFTAPEKWIYQVKRNYETGLEKSFILVVEDMHIYNSRSNFILWRGEAVLTKERLEKLYAIVQEAGLYDSLFIDNIPITVDFKIAFIDTEHFQRWPVNPERLSGYLSKKMRAYWEEIISRNP